MDDDNEEITFAIQDVSGNAVIADVFLRVRTSDDDVVELDETSDTDGKVDFLLPSGSQIERVIVCAKEPGYWTLHADDANDFQQFTLSRLPFINTPAWWLRCLNVDTHDVNRGKGIRIGVVDTGFRPGVGLGHVTHSQKKLGTSSEDVNEWGHGEAICRILGDRESEARSFLSVAPGAELIFADASNGAGRISAFRAILAIVDLVKREQVDIINLSWGEPFSDERLEAALKVAADAGVVVIAAAGNDPDAPQITFPARDPNCISVGAYGFSNWGPKGSLVGHFIRYFVCRSNGLRLIGRCIKRRQRIFRYGEVSRAN